VSASPPPNHPKPTLPKRARGMPNGKPKRGDSISVEEDEEEEEEEESAGSPPDSTTTQMNGKKGGQKRPETEEEKRRNFLERNRQGAPTDFAASAYLVTLHTSAFSRSQMSPTEKGLAGSTAGQERVLDSGESKITRGPRQHARGASSTFGWSPATSCWRRC
jgi:hypothetical protein